MLTPSCFTSVVEPPALLQDAPVSAFDYPPHGAGSTESEPLVLGIDRTLSEKPRHFLPRHQPLAPFLPTRGATGADRTIQRFPFNINEKPVDSPCTTYYIILIQNCHTGMGILSSSKARDLARPRPGRVHSPPGLGEGVGSARRSPGREKAVVRAIINGTSGAEAAKNAGPANRY